MKKILWMLMVSLGLQLQAQSQQMTLCDYVYTTGSQVQFEVAVPISGNGTYSMFPLYVVTYGGSSMPWNVGSQPMLAEDSCFQGPTQHMVFNYNASTGNPYDTLMTCVFYEHIDSIGNIDTLMCCDDWIWDGSAFWFKLGSNTVGIEELEIDMLNDNTMYDLLGRELTEAPIDQMYIQNRKKYIKLR